MLQKKFLAPLAAMALIAAPLAPPIPTPSAAVPGEPTISITGVKDNIPVLIYNLTTSASARNNHVMVDASLGGVMLIQGSQTELPAASVGDEMRLVTTVTIDDLGLDTLDWFPSGLNLTSVQLTNLRTNTMVTLGLEDTSQVWRWPGGLPLQSGDRVKMVFLGTVANPTPTRCVCFDATRIAYLKGLVLEGLEPEDNLFQLCGSNFYLLSFSGKSLELRAQTPGICSASLAQQGELTTFDVRSGLSPAEQEACASLLPPACGIP